MQSADGERGACQSDQDDDRNSKRQKGRESDPERSAPPAVSFPPSGTRARGSSAEDEFVASRSYPSGFGEGLDVRAARFGGSQSASSAAMV